MDLTAGSVIASRYRVISQIGRGGMGAVYLVEHVHTGDQLALKLLHGSAAQDPESIERFKREARAPAKIQSENVVKVVDADTAPELGGAPFLVMELLRGSDLQRLVRDRGPLPPEEALRVLGQLARALDKAHAMGIVHRDLKPENLFLHHREDGTTVVKILDFGISKMLGPSQTSGPGGMTQTGAVFGTPLYMAPEQALGRPSDVGPHTDVWAVGLIAVYLLTGQSYWEGRTIPDILAKVLGYAVYAPTSRWPAMPRGVDAWLLRSCARAPQGRFATAGEQVAALGEALRGSASAPASHATAFAPTMLPSSGALAPASVTPPVASAARPSAPPMHHPPSGAVPAYGPQPPSAPQYAAQPVPPSYGARPPAAPMPAVAVGGSTNEPIVQATLRPRAGGAAAATIVAVALGALVLFVGSVAATVAYVKGRSAAASSAQATATAPDTVTIAPLVTAPELDAGLAPLTTTTAPTTAPHPAATARSAAPAHPATTAAATATATHEKPPPHQTMDGVDRETCKQGCRQTCVDADDLMGCVAKCIRAQCN